MRQRERARRSWCGSRAWAAAWLGKGTTPQAVATARLGARVRRGAVAWTELGKLGRVEERDRVDRWAARRPRRVDGGSARRQRRRPRVRPARQPGRCRASVRPGPDVPLPQVASAQALGDANGDSAAWTIVTPTLSLPEATAWGTRPPRTAAATTATRPTRHFMPMHCRLRGVPKGQLRTPESQLRKRNCWVPCVYRTEMRGEPRGHRIGYSGRGGAERLRASPTAAESVSDWTRADDASRSARTRSRWPQGPTPVTTRVPSSDLLPSSFCAHTRATDPGRGAACSQFRPGRALKVGSVPLATLGSDRPRWRSGEGFETPTPLPDGRRGGATRRAHRATSCSRAR